MSSFASLLYNKLVKESEKGENPRKKSLTVSTESDDSPVTPTSPTKFSSCDGIAFGRSASGSSTNTPANMVAPVGTRRSPRPPSKAPTAQSVAHLSSNRSSPSHFQSEGGSFGSAHSSASNSRGSSPLPSPPVTPEKGGYEGFNRSSSPFEFGSGSSVSSQGSAGSVYSNGSEICPGVSINRNYSTNRSVVSNLSTPSNCSQLSNRSQASQLSTRSAVSEGSKGSLHSKQFFGADFDERMLMRDMDEIVQVMGGLRIPTPEQQWSETVKAFGPTREDEKHFEIQLKNLGLITVVVQGDGNCLFRAISYIMYGTEDHHTLIRHYICLYVQRHPQKCFDTHRMPTRFEVNEYLNQMSQDKEWGDEIAVRAAGYLYERPVKVFMSNGSGGVAIHPLFSGAAKVGNASPSDQPRIEIMLANYSGVTHFNAVVPFRGGQGRLSSPIGYYEGSKL